jgi:PAS domain S-box-containing protein
MTVDLIKEAKPHSSINYSLSRRLIFALVFLGFIATIVTTGVQVYLNHRNGAELISQRFIDARASHADSIATSVWNYSERQIQLKLDGLLNINGVIYVEVKSPSGEIWSSGTMISSNTMKDESLLSISRDGENTPVGTLVMVADKGDISRDIRLNIFLSLGYFALWTALLAGSSFYLVHKFITRHLQTLAQYAKNISMDREVAPLKLDRTASEVGQEDELDYLVSTMNTMRYQLIEAMGELDFQKIALDQHAIVSIADAKGIITHVNEKFCKVSGYSRDELVGKNHRIVKSEKHPPELYDDLWKTISSGRSWHGEIKNKKKDGTHYWVDTTIVPFSNEKGVPFRYVSIRNEITKRKRGVKALEVALTDAKEANQAKSAFLASMSHELRTPLNAILGFSDILSGQYFGPPGEGKYREYATDIHSSGEHLLELINDLLDISSIEAGKTTLHRELLTIEDIIDDCNHTIAEKAASKEIEVMVSGAVSEHPVYADKRAIKQILLNLLSNAIKFTPNGGKVMVTAEGAKQTTRIVVSDTGRGITSDLLPDITSPFTKAVDNPHVTEQGWGLGLAISKSLVELHGGQMTIESEVGKGTSVSIEIPSHSSDAD